MIKSIDKSSVHRITSGQVLVDLQTAVKELVENSLDAGATNIEVKLKDYGVKSFEVIDNGSGIAPEDFDFVAMKHCTSKLSTFEDLSAVQTFGFRGEALSSLCALSERVTITTTTAKEAPMGTVLELDRFGKVTSRSGKVARQRGTTVYVEGFFKPLVVRRKELERNSKREFGKVLNLLNAYALVPCTKENRGVRLNVVHQQGGRKSVQLHTDGKPSLGASISSLWGPKQLESLTELSLDLDVVPEKTVLRRQGDLGHGRSTKVQVRGLISKFSLNDGRTGSDRQFFFINGRPCNPSKIQKAFNEVYRTFNVNQSPFIVADFILPTDSCDINVSPDKRTILLHSENALVSSLKDALEKAFSSSRSTFNVQPIQTQKNVPKNAPAVAHSTPSNSSAVDSQEAVAKITEASDGAEDTDDGSTRKSPTPVLMTPPGLFPDKRSEHEESSRHSKPRSNPYIPQRSFSSGSRPRSPSPAAVSPGPTSVSPPTFVKPATRPIQMVLSTSDASWAMHPKSGEPAQKRRKLEPGRGTNPRMALRSKLVAFYAVGTPNARVQGRGDEVVGVMDDDAADGVESDDEEVDELVDEELEDAGNISRADPMDEDTGVSVSSAKTPVPDDTVESMMDEEPLFLPDPDEPEPLSEGSIPTSVRIKAEEVHVELGAGSSSDLSAERAENLRALSTDAGDDSISAVSGSADGPGRVVPVEIMRTPGENPNMQMAFNYERVKFAWSSLPARPPTSTGIGSSKKADALMVDESAGILNVDEASAERELSRVLDMEDFTSMEVMGQFNLGFIIARLRTKKEKSAQGGSGETPEDEKIGSSTDSNELDDLFIIDQHAADEKYNFETLQQTTKIESQKLIRPRPLELTAADELVAIENIEILKSNGFEISVDEDAEPSRGRVKLVAQPVSGSTSFDMKDLEELLHLMQDRSPGQKMVRCSKARAMFAMRACRKSVMIGTALNKVQMTTVVRHMSNMDQPWNCPHGRPTMRHLRSLDKTIGSNRLVGPNSRDIKWENL